MNKKQIKAWNTIRFGNQAPKQIRQSFAEYFLCPIQEIGFTFTSNNKSEHKVILVEQKDNWYTFDQKDDMAFMEFRYIPSIQAFFVVNQPEYDFGIHIGWSTENQSPAFTVMNNYDHDDMFTNVITSSDTSAKEIGSFWAEIVDDFILPAYDHKKRKTKWLSQLEKSWYDDN